MDTPRSYWPIWKNILRRQGLAELAAWALEAAGPLNILGAQALYLGQPFFAASTGEQIHALAHLLEQADETHNFIDLLKGNTQ